MKDYYVFRNVQLDADQHVLRVSGGVNRRLPVEEVAGLHLLAGYSITSGVLNLAATHGIPIHVYGYRGTYRGTFFPPPVEPTSSILVRQLLAHLSKEKRIDIARAILQAAETGMNALLKPFDLVLDNRAEGNTLEGLRLSEARVRKAYYALLDTILPPFWSILSRRRNPPRRPPDAVLGFANGILYAKMGGYIHRAGLDPRIRFLHGDKRARNPLALDLADILKPTLAESVLLDVAATGAERSLVTKIGEGVYLNQAGRKAVIRFVEDTLRRKATPLGGDRQDLVENWAASVPRKLHRALVTESIPRFPVIPCTLSSSTMQTLSSERTFVDV